MGLQVYVHWIVKWILIELQVVVDWVASGC